MTEGGPWYHLLSDPTLTEELRARHVTNTKIIFMLLNTQLLVAYIDFSQLSTFTRLFATSEMLSQPNCSQSLSIAQELQESAELKSLTPPCNAMSLADVDRFLVETGGMRFV